MRGLRSLWQVREFGLILVLVGVLAFFATISPAFRSPANVLDQSRHWIEIGILAAAMFGVITAGGIDLSVASILAACGVTTARLHVDAGLPLSVAVAVSLALGTALGAINGLLVARAGIPDLVATLATLVIYRGLAQLVFQNAGTLAFPASYCWIGEGNLLGPIPVSWSVLVAAWIAAFWIFHRTRFGRSVFALGSSPAAARGAGVPVAATRVALYTISGFCAALGAVIFTARASTAKSDDATGLELDVITCVFLGGSSMTGGKGSLLGTVLGVLIVGSLRTGLNLAQTRPFYRPVILGVLLILAVAWNEFLARRVAAGPRLDAATEAQGPASSA